MFHEVTGMLKEIVDYDAMDIRLVEEESRELVCIYSRDENAEQMLSFRMSLDEGVSGWVARHNQAQLVNDMAHDPRVAQVPGTEEEEPQASIIVPLNVRGKVTGVLCLDRMDGRAVRRPRARTGHALRQHGGDRHPERAHLRGDGAPGDQRRPYRASTTTATSTRPSRPRCAAPSATARRSAC